MTGRRLWLALGSGAIGMLLAVTLLGGAVLAADEEGAAPGQTFVDRLASRLGITSDELTSAVKDTQIEMLDQAVADGRLSQEQADAMQERIQSAEGITGFSFGPGFGRGGPRGMGMAGCVSLDTLADTLGLTTAEVRAQLQAGVTLSEIITAQGQTVEAVVHALVAEAQAHLNEAVAAGRITQEQADSMLTELPARLTEMVESGMPAFRIPGHHIRGGQTS
jgi:polyhydroxyalkanoate synthesis regulator phasin